MSKVGGYDEAKPADATKDDPVTRARKPSPKGSDGSKPSARGPGEKPKPKTSGAMIEPNNLRDLAEPSKGSSRQEPVFVFDPPRLSFEDAHSQEVRIHNYSGEPQTIDSWELVGDISVFETAFVGARTLPLAPGQSFLFSVRFKSESDTPQTAALIVRSALADEPARLDLVGMLGDQVETRHSDPQMNRGVRISATTPEGRPNSILSAMSSVGAAWTAVSGQQQLGLQDVRDTAKQDLPKGSGWKAELLNGVIGIGLSKVLGAASLYLGGGLALLAWEVVEESIGRAEAAAAAKKVASITLKIHEQIGGGLAQGIIKNTAASIAEKLSGATAPTVSSQLRDVFFDAQATSLAQTYLDVTTSLNNHEGDYVALEREHPGLGFSALEAYRSHLWKHLEHVRALQHNASVGMWMAFLARLELGTHEPEVAGVSKAGSALDQNLYGPSDDHHRLAKLASGVLELDVVWDYDRMQVNPIFELQRARVVGVHPAFKKDLTKAPLGQFPLPLIIHGKVRRQFQGGSAASSHLGIGRNEGGTLWLGATAKTDGSDMLELLGDGDPYEGARKIFKHVDATTLAKVD